jgi:hypothetical protein
MTAVAAASSSANPTLAAIQVFAPIIANIATAAMQIQQANGMTQDELNQLYQTTAQGLVQINQAWTQFANQKA